jgi:release factor glutamine methyltransferase
MSAPGVWTSVELVRWTTGYFRRNGLETPRLDAEVLLAHVLGVSRIDLYLQFDRPVGKTERDRYREFVCRRAVERVPVAYLTGEREFWCRPLRVQAGVLVPRPETEGVVEAVVELRPARLIDVGTGCGAIACAVALQLPEAEVFAVDRSSAALRFARENVRRLELAGRVRLVAGDLLSPLETQVDVIAANLPYVPTAELATLPPEVSHEPRIALDGGHDGLELLRRLIAESPRVLRKPGAIVLEVGERQAGPVEALLRAEGFHSVEVRKDLAGVERVVVGRLVEP